jgi:hypothetical protein
MRTAMLFAGLMAGSLFVHAGAAEANVRSFFSPEIGGQRLSFCLQSSGHCGKPVADAYCQFQGYDEAILFQRDELQVEAAPILVYADTGESCAADSCLGFRQIKCRRGS